MLKGFLGGEIFGRFLVNHLGVFVGDFWEFLFGIFGGVLFTAFTEVFGRWEFLDIPIL